MPGNEPMVICESPVPMTILRLHSFRYGNRAKLQTMIQHKVRTIQAGGYGYLFWSLLSPPLFLVRGISPGKPQDGKREKLHEVPATQLPPPASYVSQIHYWLTDISHYPLFWDPNPRYSAPENLVLDVSAIFAPPCFLIG